MTRVYVQQAQMVQVAASPIAQSIYRRLCGTYTWSLITSTRNAPPKPISRSLDIVSWCIGHTLPHPQRRINAVLNNIQATHRTPGAIFFQDVHCHALDAILVHPWVMDCFQITDVDASHWFGDRMCGTVALVRRDLDVQNVFRIPLLAEHGRARDALVLDFEDRQGRTVRFMSTNLGMIGRKELLTCLAEYTPARGSDAVKMVLVGEMGMEVGPPVEAMLTDVFLSMGREDRDPNGWSWGMNCWPRMAVGERRQRVYVSPGVVVQDFGRIGAGGNAPLTIGTLGNEYASENCGVMLILANLS